MIDPRNWNKEPAIRLTPNRMENELEELKTRVMALETFMLDDTDVKYQISTLEELDLLIKDIRELMTKQTTVRVLVERD